MASLEISKGTSFSVRACCQSEKVHSLVNYPASHSISDHVVSHVLHGHYSALSHASDHGYLLGERSALRPRCCSGPANHIPLAQDANRQDQPRSWPISH